MIRRGASPAAQSEPFPDVVGRRGGERSARPLLACFSVSSLYPPELAMHLLEPRIRSVNLGRERHTVVLREFGARRFEPEQEPVERAAGVSH